VREGCAEAVPRKVMLMFDMVRGLDSLILSGLVSQSTDEDRSRMMARVIVESCILCDR